MMKGLLIALTSAIFFLFPSFTRGQNTLEFNNIIQWIDLSKTNDSPKDVLFFAGESYTEDIVMLPIFIDQRLVSKNSNVTQYRFLDEQVTFYPENLLLPHQINQLTENWKTEVLVKKGGDKSYLVLSILPLRKKNGRIERLTSFRLTAELQTTPGVNRNRDLTFAENSVLSEGTWYKIAIARDGIYRIDKNFLTQLGINTTGLNPQNINLYGNGGRLLPVANDAPRADDLVKNPIVVQGENDGQFNDNDFILFYGQGPDTWALQNGPNLKWTHDKHYYSDSAYYFLRIDDSTPLRISTASEPVEAATQVATSFQDFQFIENDIINIAKSGREFFGDPFEFNTSGTFSMNFPNILPETATLDYQLVSRSIGGNSSFQVTVAGNFANVSISSVTESAISNFANIGTGSINFTPSGSTVSVNLVYNKFNAESQGWLDFLRVNAIRSLTMSSAQMKFRDARLIAPGSVTEFQLAQAGSVTSIWDISNPTAPFALPFSLVNNVLTFKAATTELREFIAFTNSGFLTPRAVGKVNNQNLHALSDIDMIIISAPNHLNYANELADIHRSEGQTVAVILPIEIYNEFSSGNPDVTAFRMLMKMLYDRAGENEDAKPKNLLLFGDGSYANNKGINAFVGNNIMVFESDNSLTPLASYVSDDYFVFLDDNESISGSDRLDCGVGRIPASDVGEAKTYIDKVRAYLSTNTISSGAAACVGDDSGSPFGSWRNIVAFVCDDMDGNGAPVEGYHLTSSETLARDLNERHPQYDISKIYMDAFKQVVTPGGQRYPEGEEAIRQRVQNGALLVTYTGHGGERGWAHERILTIPTLSNFSNINRLPVFLTATCELARFDDPSFNSAGEILLMNPNGGAIATLTTTRVVTSGANFEMNVAFFDVAFEKETITDLTLGRINMLTKNAVSSGNSSKRNFSLMGDPALRMTYPKYYVYTTAINEVEVDNFTDTLKALQEVKFSGYVGDVNGVKLTDFNGFIYPNVMDKPNSAQTQNNDNAPSGPLSFEVYNNNLFRGKASVVNGDFEFKFVVPYDINYQVDTARVSYYAVSGSIDAHGADRSFMVGSALSDAELNRVGPEIDLFMNDSTFVNGGITNTNPVFVAQLRDENGINTAGAGVGHDLIAVIDGDTQNPIRLNDFYESDLDTYKSGAIRYQLNGLTPGPHKISFKAWDVHNNSSERMIEFTVADDSGIELNHVLNYPNPFTTNTAFFFEHNQACESLDVRIQIFTVGGKLVKTINERVKQNGFRSDSIRWNGTDDFGDRIGKGVYVYKLEVRNAETGQRAEKYEKLVILK